MCGYALHIHTPVSYTHLDVYKRQPTYRVSPLTEATLPSWRTIVLHNKVTFQGYTLDVYKRQVFKNIVGMSPSDYRKKDSRPSCK